MVNADLAVEKSAKVGFCMKLVRKLQWFLQQIRRNAKNFSSQKMG